jgi:tetratricopeptide (TPR) repeat protein
VITDEVEKLIGLGQWEEAKTQCERLVVEYPTNARARAYLGLCYFRKNDFCEAAPHFRQAMLLDDKFWEAAFKLAQCLDRMLRFDEALEAARAAHCLKPSDPAITALVNGLERNVTKERTDGWQRTTLQHNVYLSNEELH